jgi:PKD repeat protein
MKRTKIIIAALVAFGLHFSLIHAQIPDSYKPNAGIQEQYNKIVNELFVEIQAKAQIGQQISTTVFAELNTLFWQIIPSLPNTYSFNIIYQQCLSLSQVLANGYNLNTLWSFMDNCFKPFIKTVEQINKEYTIKAAGNIWPVNGPAPLSVTLDARASTDPSNQTIPSNNFFWYYRDANGVDRTIGIGNVLNYTFTQAGSYRVHLTVRSSNQVSQGILDGSQLFTVDVAPRAANIIAFANGQRLKTTERVKLWLQEWQRGIVIDWSATTARWGRQLIGHRWNITWPGWFTATREAEWTPGTLRIVLPDQWEYKIALTVFDNQNNQLTETFGLAISDPVAIIKQSPEVWNTATTFSFDGSTSYSITSRLRLISWDIFDSVGNRLDTFQGRSITRQFARPWSYTIRLNVTDEQWKENNEIRQILVESTPPIAQYLITPTADILYPSEFILDGSVSSDIDVSNGFDTLSYQWTFSSPTTQIVESIDNQKIIRVTFNELGKHQVKLTVVDQYGKSNSIEKEFDIKSTLRPRILANPKTTAWWNPINFIVQTNKNVIGYEWNFGDWTRRNIQEARISHTYQKVWVYPVKLKVSNGAEENEVTTLVFVWEKDSPIPWYSVQNATLNLTMVKTEMCDDDIWWQTTQIAAYKVDRYQNIRINTADSVNTKWEKTNLKMFFQPRNDQIFRDQWGNFQYKFNDLWCQFINLTVEDDAAAKVSAVKIRFKVVNALPTLDNITLAYPQFGNSVWIWFQEAAAIPQDIFLSDYDPLIVRVSAINPKDQDGTISYFQRYYYNKNDPGRILGTKLSPAEIPHTFFSIPRMPWEFMFGVKIFDNDWWSQRSEDIIGNGPVVFFPPDTNRPDIPIVTLRVDKTSVDIGEEITFDIISRVLSDRADFVQERVIQIDFDGDGERDITTKSDRIQYAYNKPSLESWFSPRASVVYRWYRWVAQWENIIVRNALRPRLLFDHIDTLVLVRDLSLWDIAGQKICMDTRSCSDDRFIFTEKSEWFTFNYTQTGSYVINMDIFDENANNATQRWPLQLTDNNDVLSLLSIPKADVSNDIAEIFVGKNLNNSILFYIKYNNPNGVCYVDVDIAIDSKNDWNPTQNKDFLCNQIHLEEYITSYQSKTGRIYFEEWWSLNTKDFVVSFLDFILTLDDKTREVYILINELLTSIDADANNNKFIIDQLIALKESVLDKNDVSAIVVSIQDTIKTQNITLSRVENEKIETIISLLNNKSISAAIWWSIYEQAKAEILSILPQNLAIIIRELFEEFENIIGDNETIIQDKKRNILQKIWATIWENVAENSNNIQENQIDPIDMETIIIPNICKITEFYSIPTQTCDYGNKENAEITNIANNVWIQLGWSTWLASWIKILLIVFGVLVVGFIGLVIVFAIKAKIRNQKWEDTETVDEYIVPQENQENENQ